MLIATSNPIEHIADHPWGPPWRVSWFGMDITLMSNSIAAMILTALLLAVVIVLVARRRRTVPAGSYNALEVLVVFVRDMIARPALHDQAYVFLPYLLTVFFFVLGLNIFGMIPVEPISKSLGGVVPWLAGKPIGGTATAVPTVCAGLAATTLLTILCCGLWRAAQQKRQRDRWPMFFCVLVSPWLWLKSLSPSIPGAVGEILPIPLAILELIGALAKCFALMIRLTANMFAGHVLLAVLMMFAMQAASNALEKHILFFGVSILCVLGGVAATILDILVACLQAYIFTFLTAMFLGLYVEPSH